MNSDTHPSDDMEVHHVDLAPTKGKGHKKNVLSFTNFQMRKSDDVTLLTDSQKQRELEIDKGRATTFHTSTKDKTSDERASRVYNDFEAISEDLAEEELTQFGDYFENGFRNPYYQDKTSKFNKRNKSKFISISLTF